LSWGLQWNLASFAALFALQQTSLEGRFKAGVSIFLAIFGIVATGLSMIGIWAGHQQTEFLMRSLATRLELRDSNWDTSEFIRPYGDPSTIHRRARWVSRFLPSLYILLWVAVFLWAFKAL
jgi:hypothetical protein